MTLTLSPDVEKALAEAAVTLGKTPDELAEEIFRERYMMPQEAPEQRRARIDALMGSMAHLGPSHLLEDRVEDRAREERRWQK